MRVVIVGGGFGGVRAALSLANKKGIEVKLLASQTYFEYHAALYRSATGRSPLEVTLPLHDFFGFAKNVEVIQDKVVDIDPAGKCVSGEAGSTYTYDYLILALGNVTEYYGIKGLEEHAYGVKTIHEALKLKRHLHEQLLKAESEKNYVVIGGGATGVELSAELTAYLKRIRKKHKIKPGFSVELIEAGPRVTATMPESFSAAIERRLAALNVKTLLHTPVTSETADAIQLPSGPLRSHTVIWTAGVANNPLFGQFPEIFQLGKGGRVQVDKHLQATTDIFVVGDSAATPYTGMAQTALHDATFVARNLLRVSRGQLPLDYRPKRPIYAIPVGTRWAIVLWKNIQIRGRLGWVLRRLADLKLYLTFLPTAKALTAWRYGMVNEEVCPVCKQ